MDLDQQTKLELILEAANYCKSVKAKGMPTAAYSKSLREPIYFLWEKQKGKSKERLAQYRSVKARGLKYGSNKLRYDHVLPFKYIQEEILNSENLTVESLKEILDSSLITCLITADEDKELARKGLQSKMPEKWEKGKSCFLRYEAVSIKVEKNV